MRGEFGLKNILAPVFVGDVRTGVAMRNSQPLSLLLRAQFASLLVVTREVAAQRL